MKLIADSGSTKTDWALLHGGEVLLRIQTAGLNPNIISPEQCAEIIIAENQLIAHQTDIRHIYFFGAGCAGEQQKSKMTSVLSAIFPSAGVDVESDMTGAVYAVAETEKSCLVGILGTGANSCYFDGKHISGEQFSLGYILGDEGSGSWLGRQLINSWWHAEMPAELRDDFATKFPLNRNSILTHVYQSSAPAAYLASFAPFAVQHRTHPYVRNLIDIGFSLFISRYLKRFPADAVVHMIGSMAYLLQEEFKQNLMRNQLQAGTFLQEPLSGLIERYKLH